MPRLLTDSDDSAALPRIVRTPEQEARRVQLTKYVVTAMGFIAAIAVFGIVLKKLTPAPIENQPSAPAPAAEPAPPPRGRNSRRAGADSRAAGDSAAHCRGSGARARSPLLLQRHHLRPKRRRSFCPLRRPSLRRLPRSKQRSRRPPLPPSRPHPRRPNPLHRKRRCEAAEAAEARTHDGTRTAASSPRAGDGRVPRLDKSSPEARRTRSRLGRRATASFEVVTRRTPAERPNGGARRAERSRGVALRSRGASVSPRLGFGEVVDVAETAETAGAQPETRASRQTRSMARATLAKRRGTTNKRACDERTGYARKEPMLRASSSGRSS